MVCSEPARPSTVWPEHGRGAFVLTGQAQVQVGPNQHPAAIANVAKVTTACVVLCDHPLQLGQDGPTITLTDADVPTPTVDVGSRMGRRLVRQVHARREHMSRTLRSLAALAVITLISAGCSNAPTNTSTANNTAANHEKAMKFAQCMRDNGVSGFPDPDASGALTIDAVANGSSVDPNSATFQQALSACRDLEPAGFMGQKRSGQQQEAALKFAQCIRDNGVKDFPDPTPDGPLIDTNRIPSAAAPGGMTILHAAMQKCHGLAAAAGVTGGK